MGVVLAVWWALAQEPGADEQLLIYEINRARSNPQAYAAEHGLGSLLDGVAPAPPLAVNLNLQGSAGFHAQEMATFGYFAHQSAVTGDWPNQMAYDAGYALPGWPGNQNFIESIAGGYPSVGEALEAWIVDAGVSPPGHRYHLLATGPSSAFWLAHREIGTGWVVQGGSPFTYYCVAHTAYQASTDLFLTGVVYNDVNGNSRYDFGEGLSGVTVSIGGPATVTNAQGGWSILVAAGSYTVTAFGGASTASVSVGGANVAVDFILGKPAGEVGFSTSWGSGGPGGAGGMGPFVDAGGGGGGPGIVGNCAGRSPVGTDSAWMVALALVALLRLKR